MVEEDWFFEVLAIFLVCTPGVTDFVSSHLAAIVVGLTLEMYSSEQLLSYSRSVEPECDARLEM